jgi:hypothetical protein
MGVNPSDVPPWVHEYGPKVVAGLEKTAEQVAKLSGMLRGLLAATANQPRSVTIHPPWLANPEWDANDRSHAESDPTEDAYRLAWEMNKQKRITRFDDFAKDAKGLMDFNGSSISDIMRLSWESLPSYVQAAWRRHVNVFIFGKESAPNEAPSAR